MEQISFLNFSLIPCVRFFFIRADIRTREGTMGFGKLK
jgi:hypothetical protein